MDRCPLFLCCPVQVEGFWWSGRQEVLSFVWIGFKGFYQREDHSKNQDPAHRDEVTEPDFPRKWWNSFRRRPEFLGLKFKYTIFFVTSLTPGIKFLRTNLIADLILFAMFSSKYIGNPS
jgi:hypothetical protein